MKLLIRKADIPTIPNGKCFIVVLLEILTMIMQGSKLSLSRLKKVAGMVTPKPVGFGRPITDCQAWQKLKKLKEFQKIRQTVLKNLRQPIPKTGCQGQNNSDD